MLLNIDPWPSRQSEIYAQDSPVKISGSDHVVDWKFDGVMKWYMVMPTWDMGSLSLEVSVCGQKRVVSHGSASEWLGAPLRQRSTEWPSADFHLSTRWPKSRESAKWGLEDNTAWYNLENKKLWINKTVCLCPSISVSLTPQKLSLFENKE